MALNVVLTREPARELVATAEDIGRVLSQSHSDVQAAILNAFAKDVDSWDGTMQTKVSFTGAHEYFAAWPMQCRNIVEEMADEQCDLLRRQLETLVEHLEAVPGERRAKRIADGICDGITGAVTRT